METKLTQASDGICLQVSGRIDSSTVNDFSLALSKIPGNAKKVTLDFSRLLYISSNGLREILRLIKNMDDDNAL